MRNPNIIEEKFAYLKIIINFALFFEKNS